MTKHESEENKIDRALRRSEYAKRLQKLTEELKNNKKFLRQFTVWRTRCRICPAHHGYKSLTTESKWRQFFDRRGRCEVFAKKWGLRFGALGLCGGHIRIAPRIEVGTEDDKRTGRAVSVFMRAVHQDVKEEDERDLASFRRYLRERVFGRRQRFSRGSGRKANVERDKEIRQIWQRAISPLGYGSNKKEDVIEKWSRRFGISPDRFRRVANSKKYS